MESLATFKKGDKVRHKYRDEGQLTVTDISALYNMLGCVNENGAFGNYFTGNLELDKNQIVIDILKDL